MPDTIIRADIIVNTSAAGVDLVDLKRKIEENIRTASQATFPDIHFNITLALATQSSAQQYTGVFQANVNGPKVKTTLVFVDIIYNDSPKIAEMDDMKQLLYKTVPTTVRDTVVQFLTPRVDVSSIQIIDVNSPQGEQPVVNPNLERRMKGLERQIEQILPLLNSKL